MPKVRNLTPAAPEIEQDAPEMFQWDWLTPTTLELTCRGIRLGIVNTEGGIASVPLIGGRVPGTRVAMSIEGAKARLEEFWRVTRKTVERAWPEGGAR